MKQRLGCWEFKKCGGREAGGLRATRLGICPAATDSSYSDGNRGVNAGRCCWRVAGTFCEGKAEGSFAGGFMSCSCCDFCRLVQQTKGDNLPL